MNLEGRFKVKTAALLTGLDHPRLLVAVSTGVDSMTLLSLLEQSFSTTRIVVAHVNHHLRAESEQEEKFLRKYCRLKGLQLEVAQWDNQSMHSGNLEKAARDFRYQFFEEIAKKNDCSVVLTGHHSDDQAETFLMRLNRGGTLAALGGIHERRPFNQERWLVRPLLTFSKAELKAYALQKDIPFYEDQTNQDLKLTRNRYRHQIIPLLKKENPNFLKRVTQVTRNIKEEQEALDYLISPLLSEMLYMADEHYYTVNLTQFKSYPFSVQEILLEKILNLTLIKQKIKLSKNQKEQILQLIRNSKKPQARLDFSQEWYLEKRYDELLLSDQHLEQAERPLIEVADYKLFLDQWRPLSEHKRMGLFTPGSVDLLPTDQVIYLASEDNPLPLVVRHRQAGDVFQMKGTQQHKRVNRYFIDQKVPQILREEAWLVFNRNQELIWIVNFVESQLSIKPETDKIQYILVYRELDG